MSARILDDRTTNTCTPEGIKSILVTSLHEDIVYRTEQSLLRRTKISTKFFRADFLVLADCNNGSIHIDKHRWADDPLSNCSDCQKFHPAVLTGYIPCHVTISTNHKHLNWLHHLSFSVYFSLLNSLTCLLGKRSVGWNRIRVYFVNTVLMSFN